jgi:hypothetical protein
MSLSELSQILGNIGEFVGAIAVVATLFYLAVQVRHSKESVDANTRSLDENRMVQMAVAYQSRVENLSANTRITAESEGLAEIVEKVTEAGWPAPESLDRLSPVERTRIEAWALLAYLNIENLHYQYELGLLEPSFYEGVIRPAMGRNGDVWKELGFLDHFGRPSFHNAVEVIRTEVM